MEAGQCGENVQAVSVEMHGEGRKRRDWMMGGKHVTTLPCPWPIEAGWALRSWEAAGQLSYTEFRTCHSAWGHPVSSGSSTQGS